MAQDAMKVIMADELVWREHPVFKGAQTVILIGNPTATAAAKSKIIWKSGAALDGLRARS